MDLNCIDIFLYFLFIETCSGESEAYCRTVEYDYDVEEVNKLNNNITDLL